MKLPANLPDGNKFSVDLFQERRRSLRNEFASYTEHASEIAKHFRPRRGFYTREEADTGMGGHKVTGYKKHNAIINSTPLRVSKNAQSGLQAGVTSPSRPWKRLKPEDHDQMEIPGAAQAFGQLDRMFDSIVSGSNFYRSTHTAYADFVDFGAGALQIDEHSKDVIRTQVHPYGSWVGACNEDGRVDVFYRDYNPKGYEILRKFGKDAIPKGLLTTIQRDPYKAHTIHNAIEPNPFYTPGPAIGLSAFPYLSVWWIKGHETTFLKVHGYHEFPVLVFRFYKTENNDAYGYSPGMDGLGDAKQLQHQERTKLTGIDQMVRPPLQAPTSLKQKGVSLIPGKVNYHDGPSKVESLYNVNLPLNYVLEDIQSIQQRLSETFFEDLFLMISQGVSRETTAREIEARHEEKLIMLGPVLESINDELLDPATHRILQISKRAGRWPEFPDQLQDQEIKVEYVSILAQAQRAVQTVAIEQGVNFVGALRQAGFENAADRLEIDGTVEEYFERIGFPPEGVKPLRQANEERAARAQQAEQQARMDQMAQAASAGKDAAAAATNEQISPNVLERVMGT